MKNLINLKWRSCTYFTRQCQQKRRNMTLWLRNDFPTVHSTQAAPGVCDRGWTGWTLSALHHVSKAFKQYQFCRCMYGWCNVQSRFEIFQSHTPGAACVCARKCVLVNTQNDTKIRVVAKSCRKSVGGLKI